MTTKSITNETQANDCTAAWGITAKATAAQAARPTLFKGRARGPQIDAAKVEPKPTTVGPLSAHRVPDKVPMPSPTPDNQGAVAGQENRLLGASYAPTKAPAFAGPHRHTATPPTFATVAARQPGEPRPSLAAFQGAQSAHLGKLAAKVHAATKRNPIGEMGAPLVKTPAGVAKAHRSASKAFLKAVDDFAATLAPANATTGDKASAKKAALGMVAGVVVRKRIHGGMDATTKGADPGSVDADSEMALALAPRNRATTARLPDIVDHRAAQWRCHQGRRHAYRVAGRQE